MVGEDGGVAWCRAGVRLCQPSLFPSLSPLPGGNAGLRCWGSHASRAGGRDWRTQFGPGAVSCPPTPPPPHWRLSLLCHRAPGGLGLPGAVCPGRRCLGWGPLRVGGWAFRYLGLELQPICPTDLHRGETPTRMQPLSKPTLPSQGRGAGVLTCSECCPGSCWAMFEVG